MSAGTRPARGPRRDAVPGTRGRTHDVRRPWKIGRARSKTKPYMVRWKVAGEVTTRTFPTRALADSFRSRLIAALAEGQAFDIATGLPVSMLVAEDNPGPASGERTSWLRFCSSYVAVRWDGAAAKTRDYITDSLATATLAMTGTAPGRPAAAELRRAFVWAVLPGNTDAVPPADLQPAMRWLGQHCLPVRALADPAVARRVLHQLTLTLDGRPAAGETWRRRQRGVNTAIEHAVQTGQLEHNPLKRVRTKRVAIADEVDPRVVITHAQARELLTAVSYVGSGDRARGRRLVAFFAVLYYAGLRPAEAVALREADCQLPAQGWGTLTLARTLPVTAKKWTDDGVRHDRRGLKQRDPDAIRVVPIPPRLVHALQEHIKEFGTADDGRLFRNERGGIIGSTTYSRVWEEARQLAFMSAQVASPLAGRPYDLRHAALTTWLNAGIAPGDVAKRAGNSVEVLLRRYAGCLDNQAETINRRIERALDGEPELER
jgi:integrase